MASAPVRAVTDDEVEGFHRDGAVLIKNILPPAWVDVAEAGLDAAIAAPDVMSEQLGSLRVDQFPAARSPQLRSLIHESPLAEIVGRALQSPVSFYMDQLFAKPAGMVPPTAWHQDTCYYNVDGGDLIRAWVSPDIVPRHLSLEVVRGSHRWGVTYRPLAGRDAELSETATAQLRDADPDKPMLGADAYKNWGYGSGVKDASLPEVPDVDAHRASFDVMGWDYEPGDVLLFHGHILHSALGNVVSDHPRRSHASLWAGRDVHYQHRVGQIVPDPIALYDHEPMSGQLLTEFSDVFPILWSPDDDT